MSLNYSQVDLMPVGLKRTVARSLEQRQGEENAIRKEQIISLCKQMGFSQEKNLSRKVRVAIHELRREGWLICSSSSGAGYWLAANHHEAQTFINEMRSRAADISQTIRALERASGEQFQPQPIRMF
ncbi:hypothetical protein ACFLYP_03490 [Chloroflexota bacterium]